MNCSFLRGTGLVLGLFVCGHIAAQCDPESVDFGEAPWGLAPDGVETFFEVAELDVDYLDEVHLLVPSFASEVVPDTPLDAPIDSVVISAVLLVDTLTGDTMAFTDAGLEYVCNNLGDCLDPCTFLGGGQYCATFSGVPTMAGDFMLSLEVQVWATVFGFPLATPFSFSGFPFPILGEVDGIEGLQGSKASIYPNPAADLFSLDGARGCQAVLSSMDGKVQRHWNIVRNHERISVTGLPAGLYTLGLTAPGRQEVFRLSIVH